MWICTYMRAVTPEEHVGWRIGSRTREGGQVAYCVLEGRLWLVSDLQARFLIIYEVFY